MKSATKTLRSLVQILLLVLTMYAYGQSTSITLETDKQSGFNPSKGGLVIYDQMFDVANSGQLTQDFTGVGYDAFDCQAADDFVVPTSETWEIGSVSAMGLYFLDNAGNAEVINVYIYDHNISMPGTPIYSFEGITGFYAESYDLILPGITGVYEQTYFEIELPSTISLSEGHYWISLQVVADADLVGRWAWHDHKHGITNVEDVWHWKNPGDGFGFGYIDWTPSYIVGPTLYGDFAYQLLGPSLNNDLSVRGLIAPVSGPDLTSSEQVTIKVRNEGLNPQTGFDVKYVFNGTEVIENVGSVVLEHHEILEYTFTQTVDMSDAGEYEFSASTLLSGDDNTANDTYVTTVWNYGSIYMIEPNGSYTTCGATFVDPGGLNGNFPPSDVFISTIYPADSGSKIMMSFSEFNISWADFEIYDGEDTDAPLIGSWDNENSPGEVYAFNEIGALTIYFFGYNAVSAPGWTAYISCFEPTDDDFAVLDLSLSKNTILAGEFIAASALIQNFGNNTQSKNVTFTSNGNEFAVVSSGDLSYGDTITVTATWNPIEIGDYIITASVPEDDGMIENNSLSVEAYAANPWLLDEGFENETFPPEGWEITNGLWHRNTWYPLSGMADAYVDIDVGSPDTLMTPWLDMDQTEEINFTLSAGPTYFSDCEVLYQDFQSGSWNSIIYYQAAQLNQAGQEFTLDLTSFDGTGRIGFAAHGNVSGWTFGRNHIDDVTGPIKKIHEVDLAAYGLIAEFTPVNLEPTTIELTIKNVGSEPQLGADYAIMLKDDSGNELISVPGIDILPLQIISVPIEYSFQQTGEQLIFGEINLSGDGNLADNISDSFGVNVLQAGTQITQIGETSFQHFSRPICVHACYSLAENLYLADEIGITGNLTGVSLYYDNPNSGTTENLPLRVWAGETEFTSLGGAAVPASDLTYVFDGFITLYPGENEVYISFDTPYNYQGGNLVVMFNKYEYESYTGTLDFLWNMHETTASMSKFIRECNYSPPPDPYNPVGLNTDNKRANMKFTILSPGVYCEPLSEFGTIDGDYIDGVTINEINNIGTGSIGGPSWNDYTGILTNLEKERYYELSIQANTSTSENAIAAWIDYNVDGDFNDEGERICHISFNETTAEIKVPVLIPENIELGLKTLRIRLGSTTELFDACEQVTYGEAEDYTVNIIENNQLNFAPGNFNAELLEEGQVDLSWDVPLNPGTTIVEGFELTTWPPENWEVKYSTTLTGILEDPTGETWSQFNDSLYYTYNGAASAICVVDAPDFNWLITPEFTAYDDDELSFRIHYTSNASGYSKFYLMAETDGTWNSIIEYTDETNWNNHYDSLVVVNLNPYAGKSMRFAFVTENNNAYPVAIDDVVITAGQTIENKEVIDVTGYNIYRQGVLLTTISDPSQVTYTDVLSETENYEYCITAVYDEDESDPVCQDIFYYAPLSPALNVVAIADGDEAAISWSAPDGGILRLFDDFEAYITGQQLIPQSPNWTTWWNSPPGSLDDPFVVTEEPYEGNNSVLIEGMNDAVLLFDDKYAEGKFSFNFQIYVPDEHNAYFNLLQDYTYGIGYEIGFQAFFFEEGFGTVDAGGPTTSTFLFNFDEWTYIELIIDIDNDLGAFYVNGEFIQEWVWHEGYNGYSSMHQLNGADFYAWNSNGNPKFYVDDIRLVQLYESNGTLDYEIYRNGNSLGTTTETFWNDSELLPDTYEYCVTAHYTEGESVEDCDYLHILANPQNFMAELQGGTTANLTWDEVTGSGLLGYNVYRNDIEIAELILENDYTDDGLPYGEYNYYVTAVFDGGESSESNDDEVLVLLAPQNLVGEVDPENLENIKLSWDAVSDLGFAEWVEISQHAGISVSAYIQTFDQGYGVVFDLSDYPGATIEKIDFRQSEWDGYFQTWNYNIHVVDWDNQTAIDVVGPFQTTGFNQWEKNISLGSIDNPGGLVCILLEPLSNVWNNAYPCLDTDQAPDGASILVDLTDYSLIEPSFADFLIDLWIKTDGIEQKASVASFDIDYNIPTGQSRIEGMNSPKVAKLFVNQSAKSGKDLLSYKVYYAFDENPFDVIENTSDTTFSHEEMALLPGSHNYYVSAVFDEGESGESNSAQVVISGIEEFNPANIEVYPNPARSTIHFSNVEGYQLKIYDLLGELIISEKCLQNLIIIDVNTLNNGTYIVRLERDESFVVKKITVAR